MDIFPRFVRERSMLYNVEICAHTNTHSNRWANFLFGKTRMWTERTVCFWVSQAFHVRTHMFIIKADHTIHADLFTLPNVCMRCMYICRRKQGFHLQSYCLLFWWVNYSLFLRVYWLYGFAYSGHNVQKQNDKLNITEAHKMKYEGLKRFVKRECITSFAFFALQLSVSFTLTMFHAAQLGCRTFGTDARKMETKRRSNKRNCIFKHRQTHTRAHTHLPRRRMGWNH